MVMVMKELEESLRFACTLQFWRMSVFWTISLVISYVQSFFRRVFACDTEFYHRCSPATTPGMPVCVITGATSGLGAAAADILSREGFYIVLAGRSSHLLSKTMEGIRKRNKDAHLKAFLVDLSSFQSTLKFKDSLQQWLLDSDMHSSVQVLINNAGILATSPRLTAEGYDQMMGTNYVGTFALTKLLLPLLRNSPVASRIVNVTSFTHRNVFDIEINKETVSGRCFLRENRYPCARIYEYSKMCLLLFSYELHRQIELMNESYQVSVIAVDPGAVKTNIMREVPSCVSNVAFKVLKLMGLLQSPENGVSSIIDAALAPPGTSGVYFFGGQGRTIKSSALSYNTNIAKELWTVSCDMFLDMQLASKGAYTPRDNSVR